MIPKVNGWQRLWIVVSITYLLVVIAIEFMNWPSTVAIEKNFVNETYELIHAGDGELGNYRMSDVVEALNRRGMLKTPKDAWEKTLASENWVLIAEAAVEKHKDEIDFSKVRNRYNAGLRRINDEREHIIRFSLLLWFPPVVALYVVGLSMRWIIQGFKQRGGAQGQHRA